jgi:hypothetical protein
MAESTEDPREYRGGVREPEETKGGQESWADTEGVVPREMLDDPPPQENADEQDLKDASMGEVTDQDQTGEAIDKEAGDEADATESDSAESATWHEDPTLSGRTGTGEA